MAASLGSWTGVSPAATEAARTGAIVLRPASGTGAAASLALPLFDHEQRLTAILAVSGPRDEHGSALPTFRGAEVAAARSLASQAAVALTNRALVDEFRALFEGLIGLTVTALDEKSAYTGGHCRRVPILAEMLADAVCQTREGTFADFEFSPAERYELRIAGLLHDFGKVVTPVHVMDKSTKLETIHDRIELVATRYAVLQREAEIAARREDPRREAGEPPVLAELREELAFLRSCNLGSEEMDPAQQDRVRAIAAPRRWRDADGAPAPILSEDEVENLTISHGTLNRPRAKSDRGACGAHDPAPRAASLPAAARRRAPDRGLPPRADRWPGLSARPRGHRDHAPGPAARSRRLVRSAHRSGSALPGSDGRLRGGRDVAGMVKQGHLDADLFEVFLRERVHLRYAREQLRPEQLDDATLDELAQLPGGPLPPREVRRAGQG